MSVKENPLVMLLDESIRLRDSAQCILSEALGGKVLTRLERLALISITEAGHPLTISQLGRNLGHSRQVMQRAVNQLIDLGFLKKMENPDHKTAALLEPTAKGLKFEREMGEKLVHIVNGLLSEADLKMCRNVYRDLRKLRAVIEAYET